MGIDSILLIVFLLMLIQFFCKHLFIISKNPIHFLRIKIIQETGPKLSLLYEKPLQYTMLVKRMVN
jgi:hypothetical protein